MTAITDLTQSIQQLNNQIERILRPLDYESDNIVLTDENDPDQLYFRTEYRNIINHLNEIHSRATYLNKPIIEEGLLFKNPIDRYAIGEDYCFTSGSLIEVLIYDEWDEKEKWVLTRVEHTDKDYYLYDYKNIPMQGLLARRR
nr:DUF5348 domain-containing protein [Fredinandcohnia onubensis]